MAVVAFQISFVMLFMQHGGKDKPPKVLGFLWGHGQAVRGTSGACTGRDTMTEEKHDVVKAVADSLLLLSSGLSALGGIPPDVFNEEELEELNEALHSIEQGREQLVGLVSRLEFFDDEMKADLVQELQSPVAGNPAQS